MIEFVCSPSQCSAYGSRGDEMRLFLDRGRLSGCSAKTSSAGKSKSSGMPVLIEGHILDFKPGKRRRS
ncbi:MAG: hypothetical protein ACLSH2_02420 [Oscillospiraceae bacterium]